MKGTDKFKIAIEDHLKFRAFSDPLFAETLKKENKNIDDCILYILKTVSDSECNGFEDDEVFKMAVHYYDEDDLKEKFETKSMRVVVNRTIVLTDKEKAEAKKKAIQEVVEAEKAKMYKKPVKSQVPKGMETKSDDKPTENTLF